MGERPISLHETHQGSGKAAAQQRQNHQLPRCSAKLPSRCTEVQSEQLCVSTQCHGLPSIRNTACPRRPLGSIICLIIAIHSNRSEEHTSELQSHLNLVCRLLLEKKKKQSLQGSYPPTIRSPGLYTPRHSFHRSF